MGVSMSKLKALLLITGICTGVFAAEPNTPLSPPTTPNAATTAAPSNEPTAENAVPLTKADVDVWLDGYLPYALRTADIPGVVVTVVKDGQLLTCLLYTSDAADE